MAINPLSKNRKITVRKREVPDPLKPVKSEAPDTSVPGTDGPQQQSGMANVSVPQADASPPDTKPAGRPQLQSGSTTGSYGHSSSGTQPGYLAGKVRMREYKDLGEAEWEPTGDYESDLKVMQGWIDEYLKLSETAPADYRAEYARRAEELITKRNRFQVEHYVPIWDEAFKKSGYGDKFISPFIESLPEGSRLQAGSYLSMALGFQDALSKQHKEMMARQIGDTLSQQQMGLQRRISSMGVGMSAMGHSIMAGLERATFGEFTKNMQGLHADFMKSTMASMEQIATGAFDFTLNQLSADRQHERSMELAAFQARIAAQLEKGGPSWASALGLIGQLGAAAIATL